MFLSATDSTMFTSQLAEQEALDGPSLEKASERYSATLRSSTGSRAKSFQSQSFIRGHPTRFDDVRGHFARLDIEVLGAQRNSAERLICRDALAFDYVAVPTSTRKRGKRHLRSSATNFDEVDRTIRTTSRCSA
jgi:hypothetical protein